MVKKFSFVSLAGLATLSVLVISCSNRVSYLDPNIVNETYIHRYGVAVPSDFWTSSGEHGAVVSAMADGVIVSRGYSSGILDGEATYTYPHSSQIQKTEAYQQGILIKETEFYFDGTPKSETIYNFPNPGMKSVATWFLSGTPRSREQYVDRELVSAEYQTSLNQQDAAVVNSQGTRLLRDDYGQLVAKDTIENGQMVLRQTYHSNGSPKESIPYKNEVVDGIKRTYYQAGEPDAVEQWVNGQQEGMTVVYQHGEKVAEVPYVNGEKHGVEFRYRDGKNKVQEISWNFGLMHGATMTYIGDVVKTDWYYKGKITTKADYEFMTNKPVVR